MMFSKWSLTLIGDRVWYTLSSSRIRMYQMLFSWIHKMATLLLVDLNLSSLMLLLFNQKLYLKDSDLMFAIIFGNKAQNVSSLVLFTLFIVVLYLIEKDYIGTIWKRSCFLNCLGESIYFVCVFSIYHCYWYFNINDRFSVPI